MYCCVRTCLQRSSLDTMADCNQLWLIVQNLAVACASSLAFIGSASGYLRATLDLFAGIRTAPAVDPWEGHVWVGTHAHGRQLSICSPGDLRLLTPV
jgi:hypothetical protein